MKRTGTISKDDFFHLLRNARRRAILRYLAERDNRDPVTIRNVAEEVAAWEHDTTVRQLSSEQRQRVYIALYQTHLPKLNDHGVINYNGDRGTIEPAPLLTVFEPYLGNGLHDSVDQLLVPAEADTADTDTEGDRRLTSSITSLLSN